MLKLSCPFKGKHGDAVNPEKAKKQASLLCTVGESEETHNQSLEALNDCIAKKSLERGKQVHARLVQNGFSVNDVLVANTLVNMYISCGSLEDARDVFGQMHVRDETSWNMIISGYSKCGRHRDTISHFWDMSRAGFRPSKTTFANVLRACTELEALEDGKAVHFVVKDEIGSDTILDSALIGMYTKCGCIEQGRILFDGMRERDVVSWNVMIGGYGQIGKVKEARCLFEQMQKEAIQPDDVTFVNLIKACTNTVSIDMGHHIHSFKVKCGLGASVMVESSLVDMYAKCGSIRDAQNLFDNLSSRDVVTYNVMIAGYAQVRLGDEAFKLLSQMEDEQMQPDRITFLCLLKACICLSSLGLGKMVHVHVILHGYDLDAKVMNTMIDMYAKCGAIVQARQVFDLLPKDDVVTWTAIIACYVHHKQFDQAFKLFWQMQAENLQVNEASVVIVLKACSQTGDLKQGRDIHKFIRTSGFESTIIVESALLDMYCKCGSVNLARQVFDCMPKHDSISWTSMVTGYAQHGHGFEALEIAKSMLAEGHKLDRITAVAILSACNHMGQVEDAMSFFNSMARDHGIIPSTEHYACMLDLLGRAGHLDTVDHLLQAMPRQPNAMALTASLGACGVHGNWELARHISEALNYVEPQSTAAFVLLSNIRAQSNADESMCALVDTEEVEINRSVPCT